MGREERAEGAEAPVNAIVLGDAKGQSEVVIRCVTTKAGHTDLQRRRRPDRHNPLWRLRLASKLPVIVGHDI